MGRILLLWVIPNVPNQRNFVRLKQDYCLRFCLNLASCGFPRMQNYKSMTSAVFGYRYAVGL